MKKTAEIMGMPVTIEIEDVSVKDKDIEAVFEYFRSVDRRFSTYKEESEVERINRGELSIEDASSDLREIILMGEETKQATHGYFSVYHKGKLDPSGIVKGYAIWRGANLLRERGYTNFLVEIAGDIEVRGNGKDGRGWSVGIRNPFNGTEIVKVVRLHNQGIATSGTYIRGSHIYNPHKDNAHNPIVSLTVIGPNVYEADRFATAAFAMGEKGIAFIGSLLGFEGYMITKEKNAVFTEGFENYVEYST